MQKKHIIMIGILLLIIGLSVYLVVLLSGGNTDTNPPDGTQPDGTQPDGTQPDGTITLLSSDMIDFDKQNYTEIFNDVVNRNMIGTVLDTHFYYWEFMFEPIVHSINFKSSVECQPSYSCFVNRTMFRVGVRGISDFFVVFGREAARQLPDAWGNGYQDPQEYEPSRIDADTIARNLIFQYAVFIYIINNSQRDITPTYPFHITSVQTTQEEINSVKALILHYYRDGWTRQNSG